MLGEGGEQGARRQQTNRVGGKAAGRGDGGGRSEDGVKSVHGEFGRSRGRGCPGSPKGQVRVGSEGSERELWSPALSGGAQESALRAKGKREPPSRAGGWLSRPAPNYSSRPHVMATLGKIY